MQTKERLTRNAVRVWMRQVMEAKNWTASEWARRAETTPTNITRVLSPTSEIIPTSATIAKLARVAGSQPNLGAYERIAARFVPLKRLDRVMSDDNQTIIAPVELSSDAFAVRITSNAMNAAGILKNDVVFCEPIEQMPLEAGRIVIAAFKGIGYIGRFTPPWLVFQTTEAIEPMPLKGMDIIGICVAITRPLL